MIEKFKLYLFQIMLGRKKIVFFVSLLAFGGLFLGAQSTQAFADIPYNMASMQLDALDFIDNSILRFLVFLFLLVVESTTFLFISANLLDWASSLPVGLDNALVNTGWHFMSGLANISFILIFIFIALAYIFKTETWGMKKALPRLIIIAFLVNFSLLLVQMMTDIGWVFQNSFKTALFGDGGLAITAMGPLKNSGIALVGLLTAIPLTYIRLAMVPVPFLSVASLSTIGILFFVGEGLFGMLSQSILLILFNLIAGLIFLAYAILFLARIGVIWLLAIVAPMAFMAAILPKTQGYFNQWLKTLYQWVFLGVIAFFLMGLGIKLFGIFEPGTMGALPGALGIWSFSSVYYKYIFLFIYLIVALAACKKWMPAGTEMVWSFTNMAASKGSQLAAKGTRRWGLRAQAGVSGAAARTKRRIDAGEALSWKERAAKPFLRQLRPELAEAQAVAARRQLVKDQRMNLLVKIKDMDEEGIKAVLRAELETYLKAKFKDKDKSLALAELLIEKDAQKDEHKDFIESAWKTAGPDDIAKNPLKRAALKKMLHWGTNTERSAIIGIMNQTDIDKLSMASKENDQVIKDVVATLRSDIISRLGGQTEKAGQMVRKEIDDTIGKAWKNLEDGVTDINTLNNDQRKKLLGQLEVIRYSHASAVARSLGWKKYGKQEDVEKAIKDLEALH